MTTKFRDEWVDRFIAECKAEAKRRAEAEGRARGILIVLAARGVDVPPKVREQVQSCTDIDQLNIWIDRAATATSLDEVFGT